jgi:hypothetical protein
MTGIERNQIQDTIRRSPDSIWGYWPFLLPVICVLVGIGVQIALLTYFKTQSPSFEVCIRSGKRVEVMWDSQLVQEAVLVVSLSITTTFALLAFLARQLFKQVSLLKAAARELSIDIRKLD